MGMCDLVSIGDRIRVLREAKKLTQDELAKELGVNRSTLAKWETGLQDFKTQMVVKIADLFNVDCDYLLRGVKSEKTDINKATGLSGLVIENLERNHSKNNVYSKVINESINMILESNYEIHIKYIAEEIMDYIIVKAIHQGNILLPDDVYPPMNLDFKYRAYQLSQEFAELIDIIGDDKKNQKRAFDFFAYNDYSLLTSNHYKRFTDFLDSFEKEELIDDESNNLNYEIGVIPEDMNLRAFKKRKTKKDNKNASLPQVENPSTESPDE